MSRQQDYIDSVDGNAHQSAVTIIAELENKLAKSELRVYRAEARGMERAAVIADKWELAEYAAEAIRKEIT